VRFRVRPFHKVIDHGGPFPPWIVAGEIDDGAFVFILDEARYPIPAVRCGDDARGPYAIIEERNDELRDGFRLSVEVDPEPEGPVGCTITVYKPNRDLARIQAENPGGIVLLPVEASRSIDFDPGGHVCGSGGPIITVPYPGWTPPPPTKN
jgi:hypothetical protein